MVQLLHIRLLFGLLSSLCASDMHCQTCPQGQSPVAAIQMVSAVGTRQEVRTRRVPRAVLNLRDERASKVQIAPPHARHLFPGAMVVDEASHDDEELAAALVHDHHWFPRSARHDFLVASVTPRRTPLSELERPPRA